MSLASFPVRTLVAASITASWLLPVAPAAAAEPNRPPFLGAYIRMGHSFDKRDSIETREQAIASTLTAFQAAGLRTIIPDATKTCGRANYPSDLIAQRTFCQWDPLAAFVREARSRKLEVYPQVCVLACGHEQPAGILKSHPDWALRDEQGKPLGFISPGHPDARRWLVSVYREIVDRYHPEGLLLDYLRYPLRPVQMDPVSAAEFDAKMSREKIEEPKERARQLQTFREECLTELARMISVELRAAQPGIRLALYSWGPHVATNHPVAQNWPLWVKNGYVDHVNVSGYCYPDNYGTDYLRAFEQRLSGARELARAAGGKAQVTFALGVHTSHGEVQSAAAISDYLVHARRVGVDGVAFFTWSRLEPFLNEFNEAKYLQDFSKPETTGSPSGTKD